MGEADTCVPDARVPYRTRFHSNAGSPFECPFEILVRILFSNTYGLINYLVLPWPMTFKIEFPRIARHASQHHPHHHLWHRARQNAFWVVFRAQIAHCVLPKYLKNKPTHSTRCTPHKSTALCFQHIQTPFPLTPVV